MTGVSMWPEILLTNINFCGCTVRKEFHKKVDSSNRRESDEQSKLWSVSH